MKRNRKMGILVVGVLTVVMAVNIVLISGLAGFDSKRSGKSAAGTATGSDASYYGRPSGTSGLFPPLAHQTVTDFITLAFPDAGSRLQELFRGYDRYSVFDGDLTLIGYVYEVKEDLRCPVCNNVRLLVALEVDGEIKEIQAIEPLELSGEPLPVEDEIRFFRQFTSQENGASYVLGENVDGITGATKSSIHIVDALNRLLFTHRA